MTSSGQSADCCKGESEQSLISCILHVTRLFLAAASQRDGDRIGGLEAVKAIFNQSPVCHSLSVPSRCMYSVHVPLGVNRIGRRNNSM